MADVLTLADRADRLTRLTDRQAVWLALACAERLAAGDARERRGMLRDALDLAREALRSAATEPAAVGAARLEERDDVDDDPIAAATYALQAVAGVPGAARWGADRGIDAAFGRVPYPPGTTTFRPLEEDTASDVVQRELRWQLLAADVVSRATTDDEVTAWVR